MDTGIGASLIQCSFRAGSQILDPNKNPRGDDPPGANEKKAGSTSDPAPLKKWTYWNGTQLYTQRGPGAVLPVGRAGAADGPRNATIAAWNLSIDAMKVIASTVPEAQMISEQVRAGSLFASDEAWPH